ncbi:MAG: N-acetylneuraminate synthase family protein [Rhizobiaceae bacterium]|nr:N-acetylneuraminate synthase family protein [Rhizobiaceae bacterium]
MVKIIAEVGVNHNGDVGLAKEMIAAAAGCGADYVKFQIFNPKAIVTSTAARANYQKRNTGSDESQQSMLSALALGAEQFETLVEYSDRSGIKFLASVFDPGSLDILVDRLGQKLVKFGSGEISNLPLLLAAARKGADLIISTGTATMGDIELALALLTFGYTRTGEPAGDLGNVHAAWADPASRAAAQQRVSVLHCVTDYPAADADLNLSAMTTIGEAFGFPVGYSDHAMSPLPSIIAVTLGATWIEKHFTTDSTLPGPDQVASMEPEAFARMVKDMRSIPTLLGTGVKAPTERELANASVVRKSLVAGRPIAAGEVFTPDNLVLKRPGTGRAPKEFWALLGRPAARSYGEDELID